MRKVQGFKAPGTREAPHGGGLRQGLFDLRALIFHLTYPETVGSSEDGKIHLSKKTEIK